MHDKIVFITGAPSGIGEAAAIRFAQAGAKLILCGRRHERLLSLAQNLQNQYKTQAQCLSFDVRSLDEITAAFATLMPAWQAIDILINNAGLSLSWDKLPAGNPCDWAQTLDTNIKGVLYLIKVILPTMLARNSGHIINLGSIAGHLAYPFGNVYCASKFAVKGLTEALRMDILGHNIRVSLISPGLVETEFSTVRFHGDTERAKSVYANIQPLTPTDIAAAIFYATSAPRHVNINEIILTPLAQANCLLVNRTTSTQCTA